MIPNQVTIFLLKEFWKPRKVGNFMPTVERIKEFLTYLHVGACIKEFLIYNPSINNPTRRNEMVDALDVLAPARPAMPKVTREIFNSGRYCVTDTRKGLIVQNHRTGKGIILPASHPQYTQWLDAFDTAIDAVHLLCRTLT